MVITGAATGMGFDDRIQSGIPGGVVLLVFMAAFASPKGKSLKDIISRQLWPWMQVEDNRVSLDHTFDLNQDVPEDVKARRVKDLHCHISVHAFLEPAIGESWHRIPSAYIVCTDDAALRIVLQENMIELLPEPRVYHLPSGHSPFSSLPSETAEIMKELCN